MPHRPTLKESHSNFLIQNGTPSTTEEPPIRIPIPSGRTEIAHLKGDWHGVSSVQCLPPEMLSEIFLFYHVAVAYSYFPRRPPSPLILCHVCSVWRRVAQTAPKLWTSISLQFQTGTFRDHISLASAWLERARPYPVSVTMDAYRSDSQASPRIVECILPSASRLRSLHLALPLASFKPLVDIHPGSVITLESVHLHVTRELYPSPEQVQLSPIVAFKAAPRLRSLTLSCYHGTALLEALRMPWSKLTELQIMDGLPAAICREILLHCRGLGVCSLYMEPWDDDDVIHDAAIARLPSLHTLDVTFNRRGHASSFFQPLTLPALKILRITHDDDCDWSEPIFSQLQSRSSMCLEHLRLNMVYNLVSNELIHFLRSIPSLVELEIEIMPSFDHILVEALCYNELDAHPLVPNLQVLSLFDTGFRWDLDKDILIAAMIRSRWWSDADLARASPRVSRWKKVSVVFDCRDMNPMVWERLDKCREEGLELDLGEMPKMGKPDFRAVLD